jgi:tetratricopeptide (TPR) repeat protein
MTLGETYPVNQEEGANERLRWYQAAVAAFPAMPATHNSLGIALRDKKALAGAEAAFRKAIALDPKYVPAYSNLGVALNDKGKVEEAIACFKRAIALDPKRAGAHTNLGNALLRKGQVEEAIACWRKAIEADPKFARAHYNLGNALYDKGEVEEAIACYRKAIAADSKYALAHGALGQVLMQQGHFSLGRAATRRCLHLLPPGHPSRRLALSQLNLCERLLALEKRLTAVLEGKAEPKDAAERLNLAGLAQQPYKRQYALAARLHADAFADKKARPELLALHCYNAGCASALAAAGKGEGAASADAKERARWPGQALDWLRLDLARWSKALDKADGRAKAAVRQQMRHWQADADLASVRDKAALAKLPEDERRKWQKLWADVAGLRAKAEGK